MEKPVQLPPLPIPFCYAHEDAGSYWPDTFSREQMRDYAMAAVRADREARKIKE